MSEQAPGKAQVVEAQAEPAPENVSTEPPPLARAWNALLWAHAAVLLLALLALFPLMSPDSSFSSDEGAYALQVDALEDGSWEYAYKAAAHDRDGRYFPVYLATRSQSGFFPYVKHPAYPLLLQAARWMAGPILGLHLLALLGTVGTAVAAWLLAAEVDRRVSRPAFWLAATGPVMVNGFLIWAHAPSAALAGMALVGAVRIGRRGFTRRAAAGIAAALVAGVLLRSEAVLFALAVAAGLAWVGYQREKGTRRLASLLLALPAVVAVLVEQRWVSAIIGTSFVTEGVRRGNLPYLEGRLAGASHELVHSPGQDPRAAVPVLLALVLVVGLGWLALRRWGPGSRRDLAGGAVATLLLLGIRLFLSPFAPVTGLFAAWPLGLLGLLLVPWRQSGPTVRLLGVAVALFAAAVFLTQYPEGGATEWGGRFLAPILAPLAVLAAVGLATALRAVPHRERHSVTALLGVVALAFAALGLVTVGRERARVERVADAIARHPAPVTVATGAYLPRAAWSINDRVTWMQPEPAELAGLMTALKADGLREVAVVLPAYLRVGDLSAFPTVEERHEPDLEDVGLRLFVARA